MEINGLSFFLLVVDVIAIGLLTYSTKSQNKIHWKIAGIVFLSIDFLVTLLKLMGLFILI